MQKKVLITGAGGFLGNSVVEAFRDDYELILTDRDTLDGGRALPFHVHDIGTAEGLTEIFEGVDTALHLAASPSKTAPWEEILPANIIGVRNVFDAGREAGVRRIIFASSINVVDGYPETEVDITPEMPVRPPNYYGASKAWGEALARMYADHYDLSTLCIRFGHVIDAEGEGRESGIKDASDFELSRMITMRDTLQLFRKAVEAPPDLRFGIFHGLSDNRKKRLSIDSTRQILGFTPADDAFVLAEMLRQK